MTTLDDLSEDQKKLLRLGAWRLQDGDPNTASFQGLVDLGLMAKDFPFNVNGVGYQFFYLTKEGLRLRDELLGQDPSAPFPTPEPSPDTWEDGDLARWIVEQAIDWQTRFMEAGGNYQPISELVTAVFAAHRDATRLTRQGRGEA